MQFPQWVAKLPADKRASGRLGYLIRRLALETCPNPSVRALCMSTDVSDHSTVSLYIARGAFTEELADIFQEKFKIPASWLTDPLSIPAPSKK